MEGATADEKSEWDLEEINKYNYIKQKAKKNSNFASDDQGDFFKLRENLVNLGEYSINIHTL